MKIKVFFLGLAVVFCCMSNFAFANSSDNNLEVVNKTQVSADVENNSIQDVVIDFKLDYTDGNLVVAPCKITGTLTLTTESGDSVTVSFTVTASTCKEATRAYNQFMAAWAESQQ